MTGYSISFLILGATILWDGLIVKIVINFKNERNKKTYWWRIQIAIGG